MRTGIGRARLEPENEACGPNSDELTLNSLDLFKLRSASSKFTYRQPKKLKEVNGAILDVDEMTNTGATVTKDVSKYHRGSWLTLDDTVRVVRRQVRVGGAAHHFRDSNTVVCLIAYITLYSSSIITVVIDPPPLLAAPARARRRLQYTVLLNNHHSRKPIRTKQSGTRPDVPQVVIRTRLRSTSKRLCA
eukprot:5817435-Pyramimonas_sp.AAC.1